MKANNRETANRSIPMNNKFDEFTKGMAKSVTRRGALKKFSVGLAGMALACFGLANKTRAATYRGYCQVERLRFRGTNWFYTGRCVATDCSAAGFTVDCPANGLVTSGAGQASHAADTGVKKRPARFEDLSDSGISEPMGRYG